MLVFLMRVDSFRNVRVFSYSLPYWQTIHILETSSDLFRFNFSLLMR